MISITPNALLGPCDVTAKFEPKGSIPKGTHFKEYTFEEHKQIFKMHGFNSCYGVWYGFIGFLTDSYFLLPFANFVDCIKIIIERMVKNCPFSIRRLFLHFIGSNTIVCKK